MIFEGLSLVNGKTTQTKFFIEWDAYSKLSTVEVINRLSRWCHQNSTGFWIFSEETPIRRHVKSISLTFEDVDDAVKFKLSCC